MVFAYAPFSLWWLTPIALSTWLLVAKGSSANQAVQRGFFFGLGWFGAGISWVHVSIADFGGMPLIASLALMLILCMYLALFPALASYLASKFSKDKKLNIWLLASTWIFTEWLRSWFLTGFPWLSLGYSQIDSPLAPLAPIVGELGITLTLMLVACSLASIFDSLRNSEAQKRQLKTAGTTLVSLSLLAGISASLTWVETTGESKR